MSLETVTYVADLVVTNPTSSDPKNQGDDHLRNLKAALLQSLGGFTGAIMTTGTDGGAVNAYTLTPATALPAYGTKMIAVFAPTITNTGACTLNVSGLGVKSLNSVSGAALVSGDLVLGSIYAAFYTGSEFRLLSITKNYADQLAMTAALPAQVLGFLRSTGTVASFGKAFTGFAVDEVKSTDVASAATVDLGSGTAGITGNLIHITGTVTITAITLASGAERTLVFDGILTLTHNATTLICPGSQNITTAAGDMAIVRGDGAGNVRVIKYTRGAASPGLQAKGADVASATTTNLTTATGDFVHITGTTAITAITINSGDERTVVFDGILTLTHNATTLILPGGANITTAAGDRAIFRGDGAGNTRCVSYTRAVSSPAFTAKSADVASATTVNLTTSTGNFTHITGTTTITAITINSGDDRTVVFDGILTLTHNATTLILPTGANITTAAGDTAVFRGDGAGNTRCISYSKASGVALSVVAQTVVLLSVVAAANSATVDIETTFDSTYDSYILEISGLTVASDNVTLYSRLKIGGSYLTTGTYDWHNEISTSGAATYGGASAAASAQIQIAGSTLGNGAADSCDLTVVISNPSSAAFSKLIYWEGVAYRTAATQLKRCSGAGGNRGTSALTGIRFYVDTGNILAGSFRLYGIKNS